MKKILAALLALVTITSVALVACQKNNKENPDANGGGDGDGDFVVSGTKDTSDTLDTGGNKPSGGWEAANYTIYVLANSLNVRKEDSASSEKLGQLTMGVAVTALETDGDWYKIAYNDTTTGYVNADYVTRNQNEATFDSVTAVSLKIKNTVLNEDATTDTEKYAAVALRTDPVISDDTASGIYLIYSDTQNNELQKVGQNKAGTWYKVTYKDATYYIGSGAFKYFEGYTGGSSGGLG